MNTRSKLNDNERVFIGEKIEQVSEFNYVTEHLLRAMNAMVCQGYALKPVSPGANPQDELQQGSARKPIEPETSHLPRQEKVVPRDP